MTPEKTSRKYEISKSDYSSRQPRMRSSLIGFTYSGELKGSAWLNSLLCLLITDSSLIEKPRNDSSSLHCPSTKSSYLTKQADEIFAVSRAKNTKKKMLNISSTAALIFQPDPCFII